MVVNSSSSSSSMLRYVTNVLFPHDITGHLRRVYTYCLSNKCKNHWDIFLLLLSFILQRLVYFLWNSVFTLTIMWPALAYHETSRFGRCFSFKLRAYPMHSGKHNVNNSHSHSCSAFMSDSFYNSQGKSCLLKGSSMASR